MISSMARVAEIKLGEIVRGAAHYKPVALVVVGILGVVMLTPGFESSADPLDAALSLDATADESAGAGAAPGDDGAALDEGAGADTISLDVPPPSPSFSAGPAAGSAFAGGGSAFAGGGSSFGGSGSLGPPPSFDDGTADEEPLTLAATGWASASGGTPLADAGVPEATLPVGTRLGQPDKVSFVRLTGGATELVLTEEPEGRRDTPTGDAPAVQICQIEEPGWEEAGGQSFDDAPSWDAESCVAGVGGDDGRWVFDLATFADPADPRGFALVPTDEAPVDFQVAFVDTTA